MNTPFLLGLIFILIHEMDAVRCHEWRIFPGLSSLSDRAGMILFMFAHIPIFYWILNAFDSLILNEGYFRFGFDVFLVIHLVLHILFLKHKNNEFRDWISWSIIIGAAIFGIADIVIIQLL